MLDKPAIPQTVSRGAHRDLTNSFRRGARGNHREEKKLDYNPDSTIRQPSQAAWRD
jgi:hypothetical protein